MLFIQKFQNACLKVESFFKNMDFLTRLIQAFGVGMGAFNDKLLSRNKEALNEYLKSRVDGKQEE